MIRWRKILNSDTSVRESLFDFLEGNTWMDSFKHIKYPLNDSVHIEIKKINKLPPREARTNGQKAARKLGYFFGR
jgi:hypothetical protein